MRYLLIALALVAMTCAFADSDTANVTLSIAKFVDADSNGAVALVAGYSDAGQAVSASGVVNFTCYSNHDYNVTWAVADASGDAVTLKANGAGTLDALGTSLSVPESTATGRNQADPAGVILACPVMVDDLSLADPDMAATVIGTVTATVTAQ